MATKNITKKKFLNIRAVISLSLIWIFLIIAISGIVLYIKPQGRIAYWINWDLFGLNKDQWEILHILMAILMIIFIPLHVLIYNWSFVKYYFVKKQGGINLLKEIIVSLIIVIITIIITILKLPPSSQLLEISDNIKDTWSKGITPPPVPHAEDLSLEEIAQLTELDLQKIDKFLQNKGIKHYTKSNKIKELAQALNITPQKFFEWIKVFKKEKNSSKQDNTKNSIKKSGMGMILGFHLTIEDYAKKWGIDSQKLKTLLLKRCKKEFSSLKEAASCIGINPKTLHDEVLKKLKTQ